MTWRLCNVTIIRCFCLMVVDPGPRGPGSRPWAPRGGLHTLQARAAPGRRRGWLGTSQAEFIYVPTHPPAALRRVRHTGMVHLCGAVTASAILRPRVGFTTTLPVAVKSAVIALIGVPVASRRGSANPASSPIWLTATTQKRAVAAGNAPRMGCRVDRYCSATITRRTT